MTRIPVYEERLNRNDIMQSLDWYKINIRSLYPKSLSFDLSLGFAFARWVEGEGKSTYLNSSIERKFLPTIFFNEFSKFEDILLFTTFLDTLAN